jgi:hypothetical protein
MLSYTHPDRVVPMPTVTLVKPKQVARAVKILELHDHLVLEDNDGLSALVFWSTRDIAGNRVCGSTWERVPTDRNGLTAWLGY